MPKMQRPDLLTCTVDGEVVILDRVAGFVHQLNATASYIWSACDGRHAVGEIAAGVAASFEGATDAVLDDVLRSLADFERLGLLVDGQVDDSAPNRGLP
jgi:Coenzyme PQQ synthesis protein D (PqqD)